MTATITPISPLQGTIVLHIKFANGYERTSTLQDICEELQLDYKEAKHDFDFSQYGIEHILGDVSPLNRSAC